MTWTRLSDDFTDRPEMLEVSRSARLLHIEAMVWCNRMLSDGRIPYAALRRITDADDLDLAVKELVAAGLWDTIDETTWQLDWTDQESAEDVKARAEYRAATQRRYRDRKAKHERGDHTLCDARFCKQAVTGNASSNKNGHETPSRPVPSRPLGRDRGQGAGTGSAGATPARAAGHFDDFDGWLADAKKHLDFNDVVAFVDRSGHYDTVRPAARAEYDRRGGKWAADDSGPVDFGLFTFLMAHACIQEDNADA